MITKVLFSKYLSRYCITILKIKYVLKAGECRGQTFVMFIMYILCTLCFDTGTRQTVCSHVVKLDSVHVSVNNSSYDNY